MINVSNFRLLPKSIKDILIKEAVRYFDLLGISILTTPKLIAQFVVGAQSIYKERNGVRLSSHRFTVACTSDKYGSSPTEKIQFWTRVFNGEYYLVESLDRVPINLNDEIYMI